MGISAGSNVNCDGDNECVTTATCESNTCRISAGSNVNCDGDNECVTTATCESNTCRIPAGSDVNCTRDNDCVPPAVCVSMNCTLETTPSPLGEFNKTSILRKLNESEVNQQTVIQTREVLEQQGETTAADVVLVADILHRASQLQGVSQQTATHLLKIVDTVAELNQSVLHESNSVGNTTNRLIVAVEQVAGRVTLPEGTVRLQTNSTVLQVWNLTAAAPSSFLGLLLKSDGELVNVTSVSNQSDRRAYAEVDTAVLLPGEIGHNIVEANPGSDVRLSASVITQTSLFRTVEQADTADTDTSQTQTTEDRPTARARLNSKVISLRITVDGQPVTDLAQFGQDNVTTVFQPLQTISTRSEAERRERTQCVFWDFAEREGRGAWSTEGCHLERFVAEKTVCLCNHLTNFAILMDFYGQSVKKRHESILSSVTMGGLTVSIGALFLTLLAFIFVRKLHKSLPQQALFNLSLAMLISWVIFLAGVKRVGSHVTCLLVAILLHYFILVTFLWMLVQGALHYVMLFKGRRRPSTPRFMLKAGLVAWGLPALPVIIVSAIDVELYHGGDRYCWMSLTPFYYAFLVPVAIIVTTNIVIYVLVVISICRRPKISSGGSSYTLIGVRASISCFVVLGLSWVFAFFAVEDARLVFQYLFTCTTAIQGLVIFIMYPARDPDVRAFCLQTFGRRGRYSVQQQQQQVIPLHRRERSLTSEPEMSTCRAQVSTPRPQVSTSSEPERPSCSECVVKTASTEETSFASSKGQALQ
ncbi:uncharacterized protein LOC143288270 [Babylonia areolata]|uniref:uncharacterized protein LOC143288270 n=1 Tax=Babylonia areolata TaxID=304850 RepID=UPI003FD5A62F